MLKSGADQELDLRLEALKKEYGEKVPVTELAGVVQSIISTLYGDLSSLDVRIYRELDYLVQYIHAAKDEIAALCPQEISEEHIPTATDELDAIVLATEEATSSILDAVEHIEGLAAEMGGENGEKITDSVTRIYEACNFQDITGQRISKVVTTLRHIETKVEALAAAFGDDVKMAGERARRRKEEGKEKVEGEPSDEELLHGPQLAENAATQDKIDALLDGFD